MFFLRIFRVFIGLGLVETLVFCVFPKDFQGFLWFRLGLNLGFLCFSKGFSMVLGLPPLVIFVFLKIFNIFGFLASIGSLGRKSENLGPNFL